MRYQDVDHLVPMVYSILKSIEVNQHKVKANIGSNIDHLVQRFAISTFIARYEWYIPVRQVAGTRTVRYQAVLPKIDRRRSIEREKGKKKKKRKKKKKKENRRRKNTYRLRAVVACASSSPAHRRRPQVASTRAPLPPAGCQRLRGVAARGSQALFLPHGEKDRGD
ncbi:hypothetical protein BHE74_00055609, partial [Ensete ventricosum]